MASDPVAGTEDENPDWVTDTIGMLDGHGVDDLVLAVIIAGGLVLAVVLVPAAIVGGGAEAATTFLWTAPAVNAGGAIAGELKTVGSYCRDEMSTLEFGVRTGGFVVLGFIGTAGAKGLQEMFSKGKP